MESLLEIVLTNATGALLLALGVAAAGYFLRRPGRPARPARPAVAHGLWIVVLLKLMSPPLVQIGRLPSPFSSPPALVVTLENGATSLPAAGDEPRAAARFPPLQTLVVGLWLLGAALLLVLAGVRTVRFQRLLRTADPPSAELRIRVAELATRMGIRRPPEIRLLSRSVSPLIWAGWGAPKLVLPATLFYRRLDPQERDTLLAHELAHFKRRDHWVRYLELAAGCLFWWHPVSWWARRRIRRAEELCCDGIVTRTLPGHNRVYANCLLKTVEFVAGNPRASYATPAVTGIAGGAKGVDELKERLTVIMTKKPPASLSPGSRSVLVAVALTLLALSPAWVRGTAQENESSQSQQTEQIRRERAALERQDAELDYQKRQIEIRRLQLDEETVGLESHRLQERARRQADELKAQGLSQAAEQVKQRAAQAWAFSRDKQEWIRAQEELLEESSRIERELRTLVVDLEEHNVGGDPVPLALNERARELKVEQARLAESLSQHEAEQRILAISAVSGVSLEAREIVVETAIDTATAEVIQGEIAEVQVEPVDIKTKAVLWRAAGPNLQVKTDELKFEVFLSPTEARPQVNPVTFQIDVVVPQEDVTAPHVDPGVFKLDRIVLPDSPDPTGPVVVEPKELGSDPKIRGENLQAPEYEAALFLREGGPNVWTAKTQ